jgi:hypothetical protein
MYPNIFFHGTKKVFNYTITSTEPGKPAHAFLSDCTFKIDVETPQPSKQNWTISKFKAAARTCPLY